MKNYKIYQSNLYDVKFESYDYVMDNIKLFNAKQFKYERMKVFDLEGLGYKMVYRGSISSNDDIEVMLNEIYEQLNLNRPVDYINRSLSMGDLIYIDSSFYYVNDFGFKKLEDVIELKEEVLV